MPFQKAEGHTGLAIRVSSNVSSATAPVVHDVGGKLVHALDLGIARLVINVQVAEQNETPPSVCINPLHECVSSP